MLLCDFDRHLRTVLGDLRCLDEDASLGAGSTMPASLIASSTSVASNAVLGHSAASARSGASSPAASAAARAPPVSRRAAGDGAGGSSGSSAGSVLVDVVDDEVDLLARSALRAFRMAASRSSGLRTVESQICRRSVGAVREALAHLRDGRADVGQRHGASDRRGSGGMRDSFPCTRREQSHALLPPRESSARVRRKTATPPSSQRNYYAAIRQLSWLRCRVSVVRA